jgi:hypothetical protein
VVIDYRDAQHASDAPQALGEAGIGAEHAFEQKVAVSEDPLVTQWLVHRVTVPVPHALRAAAVLSARGLFPQPTGATTADSE